MSIFRISQIKFNVLLLKKSNMLHAWQIVFILQCARTCANSILAYCKKSFIQSFTELITKHTIALIRDVLQQSSSRVVSILRKIIVTLPH